jgi:heme-degrading monooxygenase HmoA
LGCPFGKESTPFFVHETQEDATPAHVWQLHVRPSKVQDFQNILSSLIGLAREQSGYLGIVALSSGKSESPDVTLVTLWASLEAIRASENSLFLTQAISRLLVCCEGLPHITEQELLASDFIATSARAKA